MGNPNVAHEPSMEEILASIRQIISEDNDRPEAKAAAKPPKAAAPPKPAEPQPPAEEPAAEEEEEETMTVQIAPRRAEPVQPAPPIRPSMARSAPKPEAPPARLSAPAPRPAEPQPEVTAPAPAAPPASERNLLSPNADAAVSGAFSALAHTILAQNARTLEDLVSEMLRPMLKEWLDDNLPSLVERLVREEIDRVSRGRR